LDISIIVERSSGSLTMSLTSFITSLLLPSVPATLIIAAGRRRRAQGEAG
jgi:hypothetical protein